MHTISVTVADNAGNVAGPVMWQFAVADPASLGLAAAGGPASIVAGHAATLAVHRNQQRRRDGRRPGARVRPTRRKRRLRPREDRYGIEPPGWPSSRSRRRATTVYRVELEADPSVQTERTLVVHQRVTLAASAARMRRGGALQLSGRVRPGPGRARLDPAPHGGRLAHGGPPER